MIERQAVCSIQEPKKKTMLSYSLKDLNLAWGKNSQIFGYKIYCECEDFREHGKIHKRYRKAGKKHGQSITFNGNLTLSFVLVYLFS